jgi:hypothetical protein
MVDVTSCVFLPLEHDHVIESSGYVGVCLNTIRSLDGTNKSVCMVRWRSILRCGKRLLRRSKFPTLQGCVVDG